MSHFYHTGQVTTRSVDKLSCQHPESAGLRGLGSRGSVDCDHMGPWASFTGMHRYVLVTLLLEYEYVS